MTTKQPYKTRRSFFAALLALTAAGVSEHSEKYRATARQGYRHGKHNGQNRGAFGGRVRAKAHRELYVRPRSA